MEFKGELTIYKDEDKAEITKDAVQLFRYINGDPDVTTLLVRTKGKWNCKDLENSPNYENVTEKYFKEIQEYFNERERYISDRKVKYAGYPRFMWKHLDEYWPLPSLKQWIRDALSGEKDSTTFIPIPNSQSFMQINSSNGISIDEVNWFGDYHDSGYEREIDYTDRYDDRSRKSVSKALITLLALTNTDIELSDEEMDKVIDLIEGASKGKSSN